MQRPTLLAGSAPEASFAGYTYHLDGELVPALTVDLAAGQSVYFEHHILLWKSTGVQIGIKPMAGALKRMMAGMQIFTTEAKGPGQIAFSRDSAGQVFALPMASGAALHVREHQFLAATGGIDYTFERVRGVSNLLFGGSGFWIDKFQAAHGDGILWLHGFGNVFEKILAPGEEIDVEPGAWLYKEPGVKMTTNVQKLSTGLFAGMNLVMNRFTGPGRLGLQSMFIGYETADN
jgi:uncharacterized protein (AIM24 family)